jgi:hypothetical protein
MELGLIGKVYARVDDSGDGSSTNDDGTEGGGR